MSLKNGLKLFKSDGTPLNKKVVGSGVVFYLNLNKVSVGLIENETIYFLEEAEDGTHYSPLFTDTPKFVINDNRFGAFSIINDELSFENTIYIPDENKNLSNIEYGETGLRVTESSKKPLVLNIAFRSDISGCFLAEAVLSSETDNITIELYCEAEDQDDRLTALLSRFGETIGIEEEPIFFESDINEVLPSYTLLNNKRKEFLNIYGELSPYFQTVLGLKTIIDFFGYANMLSIKEYFLNTNTGALEYKDIGTRFTDINKSTKLNEFGMFYSINRIVENSYDANGDPLLEDCLPMSYEAIAIKLMGLKNYIEKKDIGGASKIVDIIGERISFSRIKIRNWVNRNTFIKIAKGITPEIEVESFDEFLVDAKKYTQNTCQFDPEHTFSDEQISEVVGCQVGFFSDTYGETPIIIDEPNAEIVSRLVGRLSCFDVSWEESDISWIQNGFPQSLTWFNIGSVCYHTATITIYNTTGFSESVTLNTNTERDFKFYLRNTTKHSISIILYGFDGLVSRRKMLDFIEVKTKEIEIVTFFKAIDIKLQSFSTNHMSFEKVYSDWNATINNTNSLVYLEENPQFDIYNLARFANFNTTAGFFELAWVELPECSWNSISHLSWDTAGYVPPVVPYAIITSFVAGSRIFLNDRRFVVPYGLNHNNFYSLASTLSEFFGDEFTFNPLKDSYENRFMVISRADDARGFTVSSPDDVSILSNIDISSWNSLSSFSEHWSTWTFFDHAWENTANMSRSRGIDDVFSYDNIMLSHDPIIAPSLTPIFFTVSTSQMCGKTEATFKILDSDGVVLTTLDGLNVCHRFFDSGTYTVVCDITDSNGNKKTLTKTNLVTISSDGIF